MKHLVKFSLTALMISALAACADSDTSSHSDSHSDTPNATTPNAASAPVTPNATTSNTTSDPATPQGNDKVIDAPYGGFSWSDIPYNAQTPETNYDGFIKNSTNTLVTVGGKEIVVSDMLKWNEKKLSNSRFGWYVHPEIKVSNTDHATFMYSFGKLTAFDKMPTSGTATYKGNAFFGDENIGGFVQANAELSVDFASKKVDGKIYNDNVSVSLPTATIKGNTFEGENRVSHTAGTFYGENAKEIGGVWEGSSHRAAVFGATKQ